MTLYKKNIKHFKNKKEFTARDFLFDDTKTIIIFSNCVIENIEIYLSENIYALIIDNCIFHNVVFDLKNYTKLSILSLKNIVHNNKNIFEQLYLLGNLNYLCIQNVPEYENILYTSNLKIVKYFQNKILSNYNIYKSDSEILISGIDHIHILKFGSKKIILLGDEHSYFKSCPIEYTHLKKFSIIEFLIILYKLHSDSLFLFERSISLDNRNLLEIESFNPTRLPFSIIGTSRWFSELHGVKNIDIRWESRYHNLQRCLHILISDHISNNRKYTEFINNFKFETYDDFIEYIKTEISELCKNIEKIQIWIIYIYQQLDLLKKNYSKIFDKYKSYIKKRKTFLLDDDINNMQMFIEPTSFLVDTIVIINIFTCTNPIIVLNIGLFHVSNILSFFEKMLEITPIYYSNNIITNSSKSKMTCVKLSNNFFDLLRTF